MEKRILGSTGIEVSRLCFGSLTVSPLQANMPPSDAGKLIKHALSKGVNFIDTAEFYNNYPHIREGIKDNPYNVVICSKTYAYEAAQARQSVERALRELNRDYVDIFMLHEQESELTLKGHAPALEELYRCKEEGKIRAVGVSTHYIRAARAAIDHPLIEVVHPIINFKGLGIADGSRDEMEQVISELFRQNKGVYGMKAIGGGNLFREVYNAFDYVLDFRELASIAVGMQSITEINANVFYFADREINPSWERNLGIRHRRLHIAEWCVGCGKCVERCASGALRVSDGMAVVDAKKCVLCGYCSQVCPDFCIKVV